MGVFMRFYEELEAFQRKPIMGLQGDFMWLYGRSTGFGDALGCFIGFHERSTGLRGFRKLQRVPEAFHGDSRMFQGVSWGFKDV